MSIRRTIILLTVPLFLALAIVNGALLYFQEKAEMSQALREQALAAAITSAEFISSMDRPQEALADPLRAAALGQAAQHITGLDGLYLVMPGTQKYALVPSSRPWSLRGLEAPATALAFPVDADSDEQRFAVALAPTTDGGFVAARIDAEPMFTRMAAIQRAVLLIVLSAGVIATALAWFVARRIVRELEKNRQFIAAIGAGEPLQSDQGMTISEARELADAVRLMEASSKAAAERSRRVTARRDRERTVDSALAASREVLFGSASQVIARRQVAARICGNAPLGSFFALCAAGDRGMMVIGRCSGASPQKAFTHAAATRRFLEANMFVMPVDECLAAATTNHAIEEIRVAEWSAAEPAVPRTDLLALTDAATASRATGYAERNPEANPAELLDGIELLLEPVGVFAALGRE